MEPGTGILSRSTWKAVPDADPHAASAMVKIAGVTVCSSILPWRSCGTREPWVGDKHADKTRHAVDDLDRALPTSRLIWGGDWNHALSGPEHAGSKGGRDHLLRVIERRSMMVPTAELPHRIEGLLTIDHIAATSDMGADHGARHVAVGSDGRRLSDHDAYTIEIARLSAVNPAA